MSNIQVHKSCETLPIYSYMKILETYDYRYLIKGYFGEDENQYKDLKDSIEYAEIFEKIVKENILLTSSDKEIKNYKLQLQVLELEYKYDTTTSLLNLYNSTGSLEVLFVLEDLGWKINRDLPYGPQIEKITKDCIGLKNKIKIQKVNYTNKYKRKEEAGKLKKSSLVKQALYLENNLELGYHLNVRECSVETWQNLQMLAKEKSDYYEKNKVKK
jgi:hypothetical protein